MGPILICDKSTLQGLSRAELNMLRRYYSLNVPPILLIEILSDLKKSNDAATSEREVQQLADKLVPACSAVNVPFRSLILREFRGQHIKMDGRPILDGGQHVTSAGGESGVIFEPSSDDETLLRWQAGKFQAAEEIIAGAWRLATTAIDLEEMQRCLRAEYSPRLKLQSLQATAEFVDDLLASADPARLLAWFLNDIGLAASAQAEIVRSYKTQPRLPLEAAAPYTAFCIRGALIFHFGLAFGLISTRATNRIDLEYLYYAPFCNAFSSGDALHRILAPLVLAEGQVFVERDELKADLKRLAGWWTGLDADQYAFESGRTGPPENQASVTHQLWSRLMKPGYRDRQRLDRTLSPEAEKKLIEHVRKLVDTGKPSALQGSLDDCNFVVRKHNVRLNGPCICGSHKLFKECCGQRMSEGV